MASPVSPRIRRRTGAVIAIAASFALLTACLNADQSQVLSSLNQDRQAHGLRTLTTHAQAQTKAQHWAEHLARTGKLSHSKLSDGISGCWRSIGENVGSGPNVPAIQRAYMKSSGHRSNVLSNTWNQVGVGHAKRGNVVYTVQVFIKAC
ncbi:MAG: CAP domain-containing protein [Aquihabitans sp.]